MHVFRVYTGNEGRYSLQQIIDFEANELGNTHVRDETLATLEAYSIDIGTIPANEVFWACRDYQRCALDYTEAEDGRLDNDPASLSRERIERVSRITLYDSAVILFDGGDFFLVWNTPKWQCDFACRKCGKPIQATTEDRVYYDIGPEGQLEEVDAANDTARVYCAHDHMDNDCGFEVRWDMDGSEWHVAPIGYGTPEYKAPVSKNQPADRMELCEQLRSAARDVIHSWESGDLAGAVNDLQGILEELDDLDGQPDEEELKKANHVL